MSMTGPLRQRPLKNSSRRTVKKIPYLRWWIAVALFLAAVLNYIDRSVLGMLAPTIQKDLGISDQGYATVVNWFLVAYTFAYLFSGRVVDKLGERISLALFVGWWSISNALTGFAQSVTSLSIFRCMLGLGEAGGFTASPKAVSEWFPPAERGMAIGLYSLGGAAGATIAPILVAVVATHFGWRWVFAVTPLLALPWIVLWLWLYRRPAEHPRITEEEKTLIISTVSPDPAPAANGPKSSIWGEVLREPFVWRLMLARMLTDPVWYFIQFWFAKYLHDVRGLDQKGVAILWVVFLAADAGFLLGGFFSGRLIRRNVAAPASRVWLMLVSACLMPLIFLIPQVASLGLVLTIAGIAAYAHTSWLSNLTSLAVDISSKRFLATAFGVIACGSTLGGIMMNQVVAWLVGHRSYNDCFYIMAFLHPLAFLLVFQLRKRRPA